jgi:hypothetical protein
VTLDTVLVRPEVLTPEVGAATVVFVGTTDALATFPPPFAALAFTILPVEVVGDNTLALAAGLLPLTTDWLLTVPFANELPTLGEPVVLLTVPSALFSGLETPLGNVLGVPVATTDMPLGLAPASAALFGVVATTFRPDVGLAAPFPVIVPLGVTALAARLAVLPVVYSEPSRPLPPGVPAPAASELVTPETVLPAGLVRPERAPDVSLPELPDVPDVPPPELPLPGLPVLLVCALDVPDGGDPDACEELAPDGSPPDAAPGVLADEPHPLAASRMIVNPAANISLELGVTMIPSVALSRGH